MKKIVLIIFTLSCIITGCEKSPPSEKTRGLLEVEIEKPNTDNTGVIESHTETDITGGGTEENSLQEVVLIKKKILDGRLSVILPDNFNLMEESMIDLKYPIKSERPKVIYTDFNGEINIAFNFTENKIKSEDLIAVKNSIVHEFSQIPSITILSTEMRPINERNFLFVEFISPALDDDVYNLMFGTNLEGRLLIGTFNCTVGHREKWEPVGKSIINSIKVN